MTACGATKKDFDLSAGFHAENDVNLEHTRIFYRQVIDLGADVLSLWQYFCIKVFQSLGTYVLF